MATIQKLSLICTAIVVFFAPQTSSAAEHVNISTKHFVNAATQRANEKIRLTHGPMLGRAASHSMGVWARTSQPGPFHVRYGLRPDKLDQKSSTVTTKLENDNTGWVVLQKLKPETKYYYQLFAGPDGKTVGLGGSFRTLPDSTDYANKKHNPKGLFNFRFEFACGNNQGFHSLGTELPTFQTMLKKNLPDRIDFAILNGDWLYEDKRDFSASQWLKKQHLNEEKTPRLVKLAPTITGVWENYTTYLTRGKPLAKWHRHVPSFYTFDDHEIVNDVNGCGEIGYRNRRAVFRDIALQAWEDYLGWSNPMATKQDIHFGKAKVVEGSTVLHDPEADFTKIDWKQAANLHIHWNTPDAGFKDTKSDVQGGDPNSAVYAVENVIDKHRLRIRPAIKETGEARYSIGRYWFGKMRVSNCDFYFLDTRSHRMKHDIQNPKKKGVSILGDRQREWLMDEMAKSDADFFFVVSSVNFVIPHVGAGGMAKAAADKDDAWTVFLHEREELINFWDKLKRPVFVLTGDLHNSFAIKISDYVWEFASGPHNSRNHDAKSEGNRPANGIFDSRGHKADILWSSYFLTDVPVSIRRQPVYCVVQVNNVFNNPPAKGEKRWVAFPRPQVVFQYYDGFTGEMLFATSIRATER